MTNTKIDLNRAALVAAHLHEHACTVGCELAPGGECNADGLDDADHAAAARLLHELDLGPDVQRKHLEILRETVAQIDALNTFGELSEDHVTALLERMQERCDLLAEVDG